MSYRKQGVKALKLALVILLLGIALTWLYEALDYEPALFIYKLVGIPIQLGLVIFDLIFVWPIRLVLPDSLGYFTVIIAMLIIWLATGFWVFLALLLWEFIKKRLPAFHSRSR